MTVTTAIQPWTLTMQQGSAQNWAIGFTTRYVPGGNTPWPISGATWEYVVSDASYSKLFSITTTPGADGALAVTASATLSQVVIGIYAAATATLAPGTYYHVLWMNPGMSSATAMAGDRLIIEGAPQP